TRPARARAGAAFPRSRCLERGFNGESTSGETQILLRRPVRRLRRAQGQAGAARVQCVLDDDQPAGRRHRRQARAQAVKPKSFFGGLFGGFGAPKAKPARPASNASSTMTNLPAGGTAAKREPKR